MLTEYIVDIHAESDILLFIEFNCFKIDNFFISIKRYLKFLIDNKPTTIYSIKAILYYY